MTNIAYTRLVVATLMLAAPWMPLSRTASLNDTLHPKVDAKEECAKHTGWSQDLIETYTTYNDDCAIVCVVRGKDTSYNIRQGLSCYDDGHICYDGSCYEKGTEPKLDTGDKVYATIKILGASVRDADPWPLQGNSDAFAIVEELIEGPNHSEISSNLFCHTKTIQDNGAPRWSHVCRSNPLHMKSKLRFSVYDSDKPAENADKLGSATIVLEDIADGEPRTLPLSGSGSSPGAHIKVSISVVKKAQDEERVN